MYEITGKLAKEELIMYLCRFVLTFWLITWASVSSTQIASTKLGDQEWMTENLRVSTFRNGDAIPHARTSEEWETAAKAGKPAWCHYADDAGNGKTYGKLYNWHAVNDPRGLAPVGWRVPSDDDWTALAKFLGGEASAGKKLKASSGWSKNKNGSNDSGLDILPGGCRHASGNFYGIGVLAYIWTITESVKDNAWYRTLSADYEKIFRHGSLSKGSGLSVRCVRDHAQYSLSDAEGEG